MANQHLKKCSTSLVIRKLQIKLTVVYHFTPTRMPTIKTTTVENNKSVGENVEKLERLYTAGENVKNGSAAMEDSLVVSQKVYN